MTDKNRERRKAYDALMKFYPLTIDDLDGEQWRDIDGYEGCYQVSNFGRVKSFHRCEHILKPSLSLGGYLRADIWKQNSRKRLLIHRIVAKTFVLNPSNKPQVNHIDGHKLNNFVSNLEWVTNLENSHHALDAGLIQSGENNYNSSLSRKQVVWFRDVYIPCDKEFGASALARQLGVSRKVVSNAVRGKHYKNVEGKFHNDYFWNVPDEIRLDILDSYVRGSHTVGATALARKYGIDRKTISRIIKTK